MADIPIKLEDQFTGTVDGFDLPDDYTLDDLLVDIKADESLGPTEKEWSDFEKKGGISINGNVLRVDNPKLTSARLATHGLVSGCRIEILKDCNVASKS